MNYGHTGIDFSIFSRMEMKTLERHLQFDGELADCKERNCRVYKLYKLLYSEEQDTDSCTASDYDSLVNGSDYIDSDEELFIRK